MDRSDVITLPADTDWLRQSGARDLCQLLATQGLAYFVGGCVRDALLAVAGADVDIATDLLPEQVTDLCEAQGFKVVPTGISHGTVTVVVDGQGFEVTTFRRDVETDGRRAVVAFSTDIAEDARRRDFTLNALYATAKGEIVDPLGGLDDCLNRRIRFIEDADQRIREDYLRILRYFRFHAWYTSTESGFDPETLNAIVRNSRGLETLSAERTGAEMLRLLRAPQPAPAVAAMRSTGCLARVLPGADDRFLGAVVHLEQVLGTGPDAILRLASLGGNDVATHLRLSRSDARRLLQLSEAGFGSAALGEVAYRQGADIARGASVLRAALAGQPLAPSDMSAIKLGASARFPVRAADLMPSYSGEALGEKLADLERRWIASDFNLTREDLMTDL